MSAEAEPTTNAQQPAPAAPPPVEPPAAPETEKTPSELLRDRMAEKMAARSRPKRGPSLSPRKPGTEPPKEPPPAAKAAPAPAAPPKAAAPVEPPKETPKEPEESKVALAHARALRSLEQRDQELAQVRKEAQADAKDARTLRTLRERAKNPASKIEAWEEIIGAPLAQVIQELYEGKLPAPKVRRTDLPPDILQWKEETEAELAKLRERDETAQQRAAFEEDTRITKSWIGRNSAELPIIAALDWAPASIADRARQLKTNDGSSLALELERTQRANVEAILGDERAVTHLFKSNDKLRTSVRAVLDKLGSSPPAKSNDSGTGGGNGAAPSSARTGALGSASSEGALPNLGDLDQDEIDRHAHEEFTRRMEAKRAARRR